MGPTRRDVWAGEGHGECFWAAGMCAGLRRGWRRDSAVRPIQASVPRLRGPDLGHVVSSALRLVNNRGRSKETIGEAGTYSRVKLCWIQSRTTSLPVPL